MVTVLFRHACAQEVFPDGFQKLVDVLRLRKVYGLGSKTTVPVRKEDVMSFRSVMCEGCQLIDVNGDGDDRGRASEAPAA